jgi:CDP-diacylglycerol--glycerol-3-phosphate 3-phosphatidyltransferase
MGVKTEESHRRGMAGDATDRFEFNLPNALCAVRLLGSLALIAVAFAGRPIPVLAIFLLLAATDWLDGRLAIWLDQRTTFGARFDSVADAAMYGALLFSCAWLRGDRLAEELPWIATALAFYFLSCVTALLKFGRLPSHHTYSAKLAWLLAVTAGAALLASGAVWPLRIATVAVSLANLESTIITIVSKKWRADVPTVWHAIRRDQHE